MQIVLNKVLLHQHNSDHFNCTQQDVVCLLDESDDPEEDPIFADSVSGSCFILSRCMEASNSLHPNM